MPGYALIKQKRNKMSNVCFHAQGSGYKLTSTAIYRFRGNDICGGGCCGGGGGGGLGGLGLGVGISDMFYVVASIFLLINKMFWQRYYNDRNTQKVHFDQWLLVSWIYISLVRKYRLNNNRNVSLQNAGDVMLLCEFFYFNLCCIFENIKL